MGSALWSISQLADNTALLPFSESQASVLPSCLCDTDDGWWSLAEQPAESSEGKILLQRSLLDGWAPCTVTALALGWLSPCVLPPAQPTTTCAAQWDASSPTPSARQRHTHGHCRQTRQRPLGICSRHADCCSPEMSTPEMHPPWLRTKQKQMSLCQDPENPGGALGQGACCDVESQGTGRSDCTPPSEGAQGFPSRSAFGCGQGGRWVSTHRHHQQSLHFSLSVLPAADLQMCHGALSGLLVGLGILRLQNSPRPQGCSIFFWLWPVKVQELRTWGGWKGVITAPTDRGMGSVWAASTWVIRATNPHCRGQGAVSWCCGQDQRSKGGPAPASVWLSWVGKAGPTQDRLCPNGREVLGCWHEMAPGSWPGRMAPS